MRKLILILLLAIPLTASHRVLQEGTYYVANWGSDYTGDGSMEYPWATLSKACAEVILAGSTINIMTDIVDNNRAALRTRINVQGMGLRRRITTNYKATGTQDAYLYLYSSTSVPANGDQQIANITFDGNNLSAYRAIWIGYRSNVRLHDCTIIDFRDSGVHFRNQVGWTTPPSVYATGNQVYNCEFINCSYMHAQDPHQLRLDGQSGMLIHNNVFDQRDRPLGQNGKNISWTNVQKIKMYGNEFWKNPVEVVADGTYDWPFFMELWMTKGDCEIMRNVFHGQHTIDLGGFQNEIIAGNTFSIKVYENQFLNASRVDPVMVSANNYSHNYAITVEGTDWINLSITNNHFQRYGYGIEIATSYKTSSIPACNYLHDQFYISGNVFEDMGYATYPYSAAIVLINEPNDPGYSNTSSNWWIVNNVMTGGNRCQNGIRFTIIDEGTNINIKNNIIDDFTGNAVYVTNRSTDVPTTLTNFNVTYNDFYSNGSNTTYIKPEITQVGSSLTTGNISAAPLYMSTTNLAIQASSPCARAGIYIGTWLTVDYTGRAWLNPPSMGAFEVEGETLATVTTASVTAITALTATSGGTVTSDGGLAVIARGVCWSISTNPTIAGDKTVNGTGTGTFTSYLHGLLSGTTYYVRAYATNGAGTAYGNNVLFTTLTEGPAPEDRLFQHQQILLIHNGHFLKP